MPYDRHQGQIVARPAFDRDADWPKVGTSPVASLQDPKTGDQYFMGYNHPAAIPGCRGLWLFDTTDGYSWDYSLKGYNLTGINIQSSNYVEGIFGRGYESFVEGSTTRFYNDAGLFHNGISRTYEVVIKTGTVASDQWIFQCGANGNSHAASGGIKITSAGLVSCSLYNGSAYTMFYSNQTLEANTYYHIALVMDMDNDIHTMYINGIYEKEQALVQSYGSTAINVGCHWNSTGQQYTGAIYSIRVTTRVLKPWEFMHHWYFNSISGGHLSDGAVIFDPDVSAFSRKTSIMVTGQWLSDGETNWASLIVNDKESEPDTSFLPMLNDPEVLTPGGFSIVDDYVRGCWILDGRLNSEGLVPDISGNGFHGVPTGLDDADLEFDRFVRSWVANGSTEYLTIPDFLDELDRFQDGFTWDFLMRQHSTGTNTIPFGVNLNSTRCYVGTQSGTTQWGGALGTVAWNGGTKAAYNAVDTMWHLFTLVKDGSSGYLYVDGNIYDSLTSITFSGFTDRDFTMLGFSSHSYGIDKKYGFARFSSKVRTADEIRMMHYAIDRLDGQIQDLFLPGGTSLSRRPNG